jgi:3-oxoacyl-[acyl-carrier-protein] synthase-1
MKRAVITGLGIVSSIGNNQQEVLASLREGRSGITFSEEFKDSGMRSHALAGYTRTLAADRSPPA